MQIVLYCMPYSYNTIINIHTQALYWSCIKLIKDVDINHNRKPPNWHPLDNYMCIFHKLQLLQS